MERSSKIYVSGHTGLVGSALVKALAGKGYKNIITRRHGDLDLTRQKETEDFFRRERPEYVFLAAARVGGILANDTFKAQFIYDNLAIAVNVIDACYKTGVKRLLNLGSSCVYPRLAPQPISENSLLTSPLEPTNEPYAIAKIAAIKLCRYYNEQYDTDFISVMPTNLYGDNDNFDLTTSHVLPAMIRKFHLAKLLERKDFDAVRIDLGRKGNPSGKSAVSMSDKDIIKVLKNNGITAHAVKLWGSGRPKREFLHVEDMVDACMFLMQRAELGNAGECINIGCGKDLSIKELACMVRDIVGYEGKISWDRSKPDGTPRKLLNVSKITKMGWRPAIELADGIRKTYEMYLRK